MSDINYKDIVKDSAEYMQLTGKQKIEWILMSNKSFDSYQKIDHAQNLIHTCYRYYMNDDCTYEEALEMMVLGFHGQVNSLVNNEIDRRMRTSEPNILINGN